MVVESLSLRGFRNLATCDVELGPGINLLWGANGAGKTNLLEATYAALAGRSCRTRDDRETIAFGESLARVEAVVTGDGQRRRFMSSISRAEGRRHLVDGAALGADASGAAPAARGLHARPPLAGQGPARRAPHPSRRLLRRAVADPRRGAPALLAGARAAQRAARADPRRQRLGCDARRLGPRARRRRGRAERDPRRGGRAVGAAVRELGGVARARARSLDCATGRAARRPRRRTWPARSASGASRTSRAATPAGVPTTTSWRSSSASARCAATAPRGSSGRHSWRSCSPSAGPCSTTAARRRSCCSTTSPPSSTPTTARCSSGTSARVAVRR